MYFDLIMSRKKAVRANCLFLFQIKEDYLKVAIFKVETAEEVARRLQSTPYSKYVNIVVGGTLKPGYDGLSCKGTLLLESPKGQGISLEELYSEVKELFLRQFTLY